MASVLRIKNLYYVSYHMQVKPWTRFINTNIDKIVHNLIVFIISKHFIVAMNFKVETR
jgi:hypothetical protein